MPYDDQKQTRAQFFRKLTYYISGIAIGFMVLGVVNNAKKQRMLQQKQDEAAKQLAPKQSSSEFPPPPAAEPAVDIVPSATSPAPAPNTVPPAK
jgi:hypothetical protein